MNPFDLTPDDEPLDVAAVNADDGAVERLRRALSPDAAVVWDDDDDEVDPAVGLLRALQRDVTTDLPVDQPGLPAEVIPLASRRRLGRGATVAVVAASVLSLGGVAAASSSGGPLSGVRHAVSSAVTDVVNAITPDAPVGPKPAKPSPSSTPPGSEVSAAARSAAAAIQLDALLLKAARFLDRGQYAAASEQLDTVARRLPLVTNTTAHDALAARLTALQARLAAVRDRERASHEPDAKESQGPDGKSNDGQGQDGSRDNGGDHKASPRPEVAPTHAERSGRSDNAGGSPGSELSHDATHAPEPADVSGTGKDH